MWHNYASQDLCPCWYLAKCRSINPHHTTYDLHSLHERIHFSIPCEWIVIGQTKRSGGIAWRKKLFVYHFKRYTDQKPYCVLSRKQRTKSIIRWIRFGKEEVKVDGYSVGWRESTRQHMKGNCKGISPCKVPQCNKGWPWKHIKGVFLHLHPTFLPNCTKNSWEIIKLGGKISILLKCLEPFQLLIKISPTSLKLFWRLYVQTDQKALIHSKSRALFSEKKKKTIPIYSYVIVIGPRSKIAKIKMGSSQHPNYR